MPGKRSRAIAAALSHPDLSPAPGLVLAPVFTAASAAPAAPSSPLPDWPAPTGECPPHPQRSPLIAASLAHLPSRLDVAASSCPQVGTRPGTSRPSCSFHAFSCRPRRPRRNEHRRCTSARPARVASLSRVSALVGSTRVDRRLALRPPPPSPELRGERGSCGRAVNTASTPGCVQWTTVRAMCVR